MATKTKVKTVETKAAPAAEKTERKGRYFFAVGKRKSSVARVRLYDEGKGEITVNEKPFEDYFFGDLISRTKTPLKLVELTKRFDIVADVDGGGISSQADAVRHGITRALLQFDSSLRAILKRGGFLTRDSRAKERKKPGLLRARRAPQWSKR